MNLVTPSAPAAAPRPRPTEYDRFRNHMGSAWAQLREASSNATFSQHYTSSQDVSTALRQARLAEYKLGKALDLGYQNSDDSLNYAHDALDSVRQGVQALAPFEGSRFEAPTFPTGLETGMATAQGRFSSAQEMILESLDTMHA